MNRGVLNSILAFTVTAALPGFAQPDRGGSFDHKFLSKMPHHHQGGVEMADLCQQKATHSELKTFCSKIASDQRSEKTQMEQWRSQWFGGKDMRVPEMPRMQAQQKKRMKNLRGATGAAFGGVSHGMTEQTVKGCRT